MTVRADLAAAATIPEVTNVTPYYRQSMRAGDGFVRFSTRARDDSGFGFMDTWQVWLAVPQDVPEGERWLEANLDALVAAIAPVMIVTEVQPSELVLTDARIYGVVITGVVPV